jgi:hypothetical protein
MRPTGILEKVEREQRVSDPTFHFYASKVFQEEVIESNRQKNLVALKSKVGAMRE